MTAPAFNDVVAIRDHPRALDAAERALTSSGMFGAVGRPAPGWVVAVAALPSGGSARVDSLTLIEAAAEPTGGDLGRLARLADKSPERLGEIPGDLSFLRIRADGSCLLARAPGGAVPLYLWEETQRLALSSRIGLLVRFALPDVRIDPLATAMWLEGNAAFPDGRTPVAGVRELPRGHYLTAPPNERQRIVPYWDPRRATGVPAASRDRTEWLAGLLEDSVKRSLDPRGGNLLSLSGGLDSSSLAMLASRTGAELSTVSLVPSPGEPATAHRRRLDDLDRRCSFHRRWFFDMRLETRLALVDRAPRVGLPVLHPVLGALGAIVAEEPVRVLLGGEFDDELLGSYCTLPEWAEATSLPRLIASLNRLPSGPRDILRWMRLRWARLRGRPVMLFPDDLPEFIRPEIRAEYREWRDRRRALLRGARDARPRLDLRLALGDAAIAMNWEACAALGVRRAFPFFRREILELAYSSSPRELIGPGIKRPIRAALRGRVPDEILDRRKEWLPATPGESMIPWSGNSLGLAEILLPDAVPRPGTLLPAKHAIWLAVVEAFVQSVHDLRKQGLPGPNGAQGWNALPPQIR